MGLKSTYHHIVRSQLMRNAGNLLSASVFAQVIGLLVYPILTRIYSPADFGLLSLFTNIAGVLVMFTTWEYHYAIVLPDEERDAEHVMRLCLRLLVVATVVVALSVVFRNPIASLFKTPELARYYPLMPVMVFFLGLWNILNYWFIRQKAFSRISRYQYSVSVVTAGSKWGLGALSVAGGMIYASVLAPMVSCIGSVVMGFQRYLRCFARPLPSGGGLRKVASRYRNFPIYTFPRDVVNIVAGQLPVFVLTPCFGSYDVGLWSMALLLGFVPINMITKALYQVLYQDCAERVNKHIAVLPLIRRFARYCTFVTLPVFMALYFVLPALTSWLLGAEWEVSGRLIRWMLPWLWASALTASTCFLSDVFMKQRVGLYFEILLAVFRFAGVGIGVWMQNFTVAIAGYSIGSTIAIFAQFFWLLSLCKKHDKALG